MGRTPFTRHRRRPDAALALAPRKRRRTASSASWKERCAILATHWDEQLRYRLNGANFGGEGRARCCEFAAQCHARSNIRNRTATARRPVTREKESRDRRTRGDENVAAAERPEHTQRSRACR